VNELNHIRTTTSEKTDGKKYGIELSYMITIICSLLASLFMFVILQVTGLGQENMFNGLLIGGQPFFLTVLYVLFFFFNKDPHFHDDFWDKLLRGKHLNTTKCHRSENPFIAATYD